jgi:Domain of unknown function (DUF4389)
MWCASGDETLPTMASHIAPYPVYVEGHLERPSRWLWLVKWLLAIPHYVLLALLWIGFIACSLVAFVAVLFTGRYPRGIFDFNVGVLRWTWRVAFYAYGANGTDRYPPFTLDDVPDYPARFDVAYPERQRRGLPLIGWWLAGLPHYVIVGIFVGSGVAVGIHFGLIGVLVVVGVVILLVRGTYPRSVFDLVLGLNRWVLRVVAYAALMTPDYPPFRLDVGEAEPAAQLTLPGTTAPEGQMPLAGEAAPPRRWGPGRVALAVGASIAALLALCAVAAAAIALVYHGTQRNSDGYLMTNSRAYSTPTYALMSDSYRAGTSGDWFVARDILGKVRIQATSAAPVFIGIAPERAARAYLTGVAHEETNQFDAHRSDFRLRAGGAPRVPPTASQIWDASATGRGTTTLTWKPHNGNWRVVLMNADVSRNVRADVRVGARFPHLLAIALIVLGIGLLLALLGAAGFHRAFRRR